MRDYLFNLLNEYYTSHTTLLTNILVVGLIVITTIIIHLFLHLILFRALGSKLKKSPLLFLNLLVEKSLLTNLAFTIQGVLLEVQLRLWIHEHTLREISISVVNVLTLIYGLLTIFALLNTIETYCYQRQLTQRFPIRGIIQAIKIMTSIGISIIIISTLLGKSPLFLLSGLGAMTAVLMLVFKDPIMGLVAGIQLSANRMLNIGDWLEMPKYNADGSVIDIALTTVKVQNWDNTITTIPTYALISDSFKNWRGMSESGGRRIKRAIYINSNSVHFLSQQEIQHLSQSLLLTQYLEKRVREIKAFNEKFDIHNQSPLNGRHLTNLGTFRMYLQNYLTQHPQIRQDMTLMVRQLTPSEQGIPLEIYCFTNTVVWKEYESIQSDIFDHIFAIISEFNLQVFQNPSGQDVRSIQALHLDNVQNTLN